MAIAIDVTIKLDLPFGALDYATLEHLIHTACAEAQLPVIDVEIDQTRPLDSPLPGNAIPPPDLPVGPGGVPLSRPPGSRF